MSRVATAWRWLLAKVRDRRTQLRLCLRVTVAALTSFVLAQFLTIPLAGLWAVLTAVVVTQMSLGGSLKATIDISWERSAARLTPAQLPPKSASAKNSS